MNQTTAKYLSDAFSLSKYSKMLKGKPMSLEDRYAKMETKELARIISLDKEQYTPEAIAAAKVELRKRGETNESLASMITEGQEKKKASEEKLRIMPNQLQWTKTGVASRIINETTNCKFIISTALNPYGVWETAIFEANRFFIPKSLSQPLFILNAFTRKEAQEQHIQAVSDFQSQDIAQLSKGYHLEGSLTGGQRIYSETEDMLHSSSARHKLTNLFALLYIGCRYCLRVFKGRSAEERLIRKIDSAIIDVQTATYARLRDKYAKHRLHGLIAGAVVNELFSNESPTEEGRQFAKKHAKLIRQKISELKEDTRLRTVMTQILRVKAAIETGFRLRSAEEAMRPLERLSELGILIPGGETPSLDTFLLLVQDYCREQGLV